VRLIGTPDLLEPTMQALAHQPGFSGAADWVVHLRHELPAQLELHDEVQWLSRFETGTTMLLDPCERVALMQWEAPLKTHLHCAPLLHILRGILEGSRISLMHAAAVGRPDGAVLLIGRGGSGKSTTALLALKAGWAYLADDYCAMRLEPRPTVFSLFSSAKFHFDNPLTTFLEQQHNPDREKGYTMLYPRYEHQLLVSAPIRAVVLPRLGGTLGLEPISSAAALLALAPNTLLQLGTRQAALSDMAALLRGVPSYALNLGDDPSAVPAALELLLGR
jgi:hypothetical protein